MPNPNTIRVYEAMFLVDSGDAGVWDDLTKHLSTLLTRNGAELIGLTRWDERKLAYPVGKHKRGTYVLAFFMMTSGAGVAEIEHDCQLSERVIRALVLKADHFTVTDMRQQLGEDIREDAALKLQALRAESAPAAAVAADTPAPQGPEPEDAPNADGAVPDVEPAADQ